VGKRREIIKLTRTEQAKLNVMSARRQSHWTRRLALRLSRWLNAWSARP
jgi:hypothetical protein